jgi:hypothetical protein
MGARGNPINLFLERLPPVLRVHKKAAWECWAFLLKVQTHLLLAAGTTWKVRKTGKQIRLHAIMGIALDPNYATAHTNLGNQAIACCRQAEEPDFFAAGPECKNGLNLAACSA